MYKSDILVSNASFGNVVQNNTLVWKQIKLWHLFSLLDDNTIEALTPVMPHVYFIEYFFPLL